MRRLTRIRTLLACVGTALLTATLPAAAHAATGPAGEARATTSTAAASSPSPHVVDACGPVGPGRARCFAQVRTDVHAGKGVRGKAARAVTGTATPLPPGYGPADLASAYNLPSTGGTGQTIAIIDAGDDPTAEADLAVYRATYGLPACTTANGCFRKVNQRGATSPLPPDEGWGIEIALDLDMASAACPNCDLLLVEGDQPNLAALGTAVNTAVALGATEVSNSYGATEQNGIQNYAADYSHPGVAIVASSGDNGYLTPNFPAVLDSVVAVGGTTLTPASNARGWTETAWQAAGSSCSAWIDKPAWQQDPNCPGRMVADVAAVADPRTGPAVYDTEYGGWLIVGGTSASSPYIAGVIALAGNPGMFPNASYLYSHATSLNDVTEGSNFMLIDCGGDYQCNAVTGYDGPTGNGTPNGLGAF
ncbi:S8 family serine peptidase [Streptomyces sp. NPDC091217]|uniref:S53 family peptidase n=1 Tax=Streptomyces sp. NPDC091217 TaxID=3365975 RepID=UPI0038112695